MTPIDRDELLKELEMLKNASEKFWIDYPDEVVAGSSATIAIDHCKARVINAPVIEAKPIIHGRWIINADGYYPFCSNCRNEPKSMSNYCPNCGAKMDEEVLV